MPISLLTFGDADFGRSLHDWSNEFAYAMGANFNLENADYGMPETIVLAIICLPAALVATENGTSLKRGSSEFWSTFHADYFAFSSRSPSKKIAAVENALVGAIKQIPDKRMHVEMKEDFIRAAALAGATLLAETDRHPR